MVTNEDDSAGKGLFHIYRRGQRDGSGISGVLLCGAGRFDHVDPDDISNWFEEISYDDTGSGLPPLGLAVFEGRISGHHDVSGDWLSRCTGAWRRLNAEELQRYGRGLSPWPPTEGSELAVIAARVRDRCGEEVAAAWERAVANMRCDAVAMLSPGLVASLCSLPKAEAAAVFEAVASKLNVLDVELCAELEPGHWVEAEPHPERKGVYLVWDDDRDEYVAYERDELAKIFVGSHELERALAERDGVEF